MEIIDIVRKLTGPIEPVGETHTDDKRFENLKVRLELMLELHKEIDEIAMYYAHRQEFSMARAGKECDKYLKQLGIPEDA